MRNIVKLAASLVIATRLVGVAFAHEAGSSGLSVNEQVWNAFSKAEQASMLAKFPLLEIVPSASVGVIQSVQGADRSTAGTNTGAMLGSAVGQAVYIDRAFKPGNNYSATSHLGVALLGALIGRGMDTPAQRKFIFNYAIRTLDGEIREVRVESSEEFTRPVGQCVRLTNVEPVEAVQCSADKVGFLKRLSAIGTAGPDATLGREPAGLVVSCRVDGVGMVTLDKNACLQLGGKPER